jgi:hypothetical protein
MADALLYRLMLSTLSCTPSPRLVDELLTARSGDVSGPSTTLAGPRHYTRITPAAPFAADCHRLGRMRLIRGLSSMALHPSV